MSKAIIKSSESYPFEPEVGQYYRNDMNGGVYILCTPNYSKYVLIEITAGTRWTNESNSANGAFGGKKKQFSLIEDDAEINIQVSY